jgi:hypothetical protein
LELVVAHFEIEQNDDGTVRQILRDGQHYNSSLKLEQLFSIPKIYFRTSKASLESMHNQPDDRTRRSLGLQVFLMALTGVEAFTNTYFHLRGIELKDERLAKRTQQGYGSLSKKILELSAMTPESEFSDKEVLLEKIFDLSQLRNEIVHPRWTPSSATFQNPAPVVIEGLVENIQATFEDAQFCGEALLWCLLLVARIGEARGEADASGFLFHWTDNYGLTLQNILNDLDLGKHVPSA